MSGSNDFFLTHIQVFQWTGKAIWYPHPFKNFPQFIMLHTVKDFSIVSEVEVVGFLKPLCFFHDSAILAIWSLFPLPLQKAVPTYGNAPFMYYWSLAWRFLRINLLACERSTIVQKFENSLALPFFGTGMKTEFFQSCGQCWVFQICWHIECNTFKAFFQDFK